MLILRKFAIIALLSLGLAVPSTAFAGGSSGGWHNYHKHYKRGKREDTAQLRASVVTLLGIRISQLQVERDAAKAILRDRTASRWERRQAARDYRKITSRQWRLKAKIRSVRRLSYRKLVRLETYLLKLVSPA